MDHFSKKVQRSELHPDEVMWTPAQCLHGVRNLSTSFAITCNYIKKTNSSPAKLWVYNDSKELQDFICQL